MGILNYLFSQREMSKEKQVGKAAERGLRITLTV
jgi:hypothetical protein